MKDIDKTNIREIAKYSDWKEPKVRDFMNRFYYPNKENWIDFSKILTLVLGAGLLGIGIIFFFAYNWEIIPKFTKLGIIFGLIVVFTIISILPKPNLLIKKISLTLAATMIGVLFAVFGQIYQTGANAYDFFLAWAIFSLIWVIVARFIPLWILYILLLNTTLFFYFNQIKSNVKFDTILNYFYLLNFIALAANYFIFEYIQKKPNRVIMYLLALICVVISTMFFGNLIFETQQFHAKNLLAILHFFGLSAIAYLSVKYKHIAYFALVGISLILIFCFLIIKTIHNELVYYPLMLFIVLATTLLILGITNILKKWKNE